MVDDSPMAVALAHQRAGRLAEAEDACRTILAERPEEASAWHLLGVVAHQRGRHPQAPQFLTPATSRYPPKSEVPAPLRFVVKKLGDRGPAANGGNRESRARTRLKPVFCRGMAHPRPPLSRRGKGRRATQRRPPPPRACRLPSRRPVPFGRCGTSRGRRRYRNCHL